MTVYAPPGSLAVWSLREMAALGLACLSPELANGQDAARADGGTEGRRFGTFGLNFASRRRQTIQSTPAVPAGGHVTACL